MFDTLIQSLAFLCAHFCEQISFINLSQVNKYWLNEVFSHKAAFKYFRTLTTNHHVYSSFKELIIENRSPWKYLSVFRLTVYYKEDVELLQHFCNLQDLHLQIPGVDQFDWKTEY